MQSSLDPELHAVYMETDYTVSDDPPLLMRIGEQNPDAAILRASLGVTEATFITAWNPGSQRLSDEENDDRQSELLTEIELLRLNYLVGYGEREDWREYSYLILGIEYDDAVRLAQQFQQNAFVWVAQDGMPELVTL